MNFVDLCGHMPILLDYLPPGSIPALSATCSTLRLLIRCFATSLTMTSGHGEMKHEPDSYAISMFAHVKLLTSGPQWRRLEVLHIEECVLGSLAVGELSRAKFPRLHKLSLSQVSLKTGLVRTLSQAKWISLRYLDLSCNGLANKAFGALVAGEAGPWQHLQHLNLSTTTMSNKGLQEFCRGEWGELTHQDLSQNLFDDRGAAAMAAVSWPKLQTLNLSSAEPACGRSAKPAYLCWQNLSCSPYQDAVSSAVPWCQLTGQG